MATSAYQDMQYLMDTAYFHPSRDGKFPTAEIKRSARCAMELLWQVEAIVMFDFVFTKAMIHRMMIEEMTVSELDTALEWYGRREEKSIVCLSVLIFLALVTSDVRAQAMYERDYGEDGIYVEATEDELT